MLVCLGRLTNRSLGSQFKSCANCEILTPISSWPQAQCITSDHAIHFRVGGNGQRDSTLCFTSKGLGQGGHDATDAQLPNDPVWFGAKGGRGRCNWNVRHGLRFFFHVQPPGLHQSVGMGLLNWPTWQHNPSWGQPWGGVCCRGPLKQGWKGGGQREGVGSRAAGQIIGTGWPVLEPEMRPTKGLRRSTGSSVDDKSRGRRNNGTPGLANAFRAPTETCTVTRARQNGGVRQ